MSKNLANHDNFVQPQFEKNRRRFTVQRTESSISNVSSKNENSDGYAVFLCIIKWLVAVFLLIAVLYCVVASKICLLVLGQQFRKLNQRGESGSDKTVTERSKQALFLMLLLALLIPQAVSFFYASWTSMRRKTCPWPSKQGLILVRLIFQEEEFVVFC